MLHTENEAGGGGGGVGGGQYETLENVGWATMLPCAVNTYWQTKGLCVTFWETLVYFSVTVEILAMHFLINYSRVILYDENYSNVSTQFSIAPFNN